MRFLSALSLTSFLFLLWPLVNAKKPWSAWMAESAMARGQGNGLGSDGKPFITYEHGVFQRALESLYNKTSETKYLDYFRQGVDRIVNDDGSLNSYNLTFYTIDDIRLGQGFIYWHQKTGLQKYKTAADTLMLQLVTTPRTPAGAIWHRSTFYEQQWLDGIYMADVFYGHYTAFYSPKNATAWDDILLQFNLLNKNLYDPRNGLLKHGYDASKTAVWADEKTGACPEVWDRAVGWYVMALVDVLDYWPQWHPGRAVVLGYLKSIAPRLVAAIEPKSGIWWLVMSQPGRAGNRLESSAASMFVYGFLKAVRKGYLTGTIYKPVAKRAYEYLVNNYIVKETDGTLGWEGTVLVGALDTPGDFDYYIGVPNNKNDLKGVSPFIFASLEYENAFN